MPYHQGLLPLKKTGRSEESERGQKGLDTLLRCLWVLSQGARKSNRAKSEMPEIWKQYEKEDAVRGRKC